MIRRNRKLALKSKLLIALKGYADFRSALAIAVDLGVDRKTLNPYLGDLKRKNLLDARGDRYRGMVYKLRE